MTRTVEYSSRSREMNDCGCTDRYICDYLDLLCCEAECLKLKISHKIDSLPHSVDALRLEERIGYKLVY